MNFYDLDDGAKLNLQEKLTSNAMSIGGLNTFLQMIEDIRKESTSPLLNKNCVYNFSKGLIKWNKSIYGATYSLLLDSLKRYEKDGNSFTGLTPNQKKSAINMMKTLKPLEIKFSPKNKKDGDGFTINVFDEIDGENTTASLVFKSIFFYNIDVAKKALTYKSKNEQSQE